MPNAALDSAAPSLARPGADPIARSLRELRPSPERSRCSAAKDACAFRPRHPPNPQALDPDPSGRHRADRGSRISRRRGRSRIRPIPRRPRRRSTPGPAHHRRRRKIRPRQLRRARSRATSAPTRPAAPPLSVAGPDPHPAHHPRGDHLPPERDRHRIRASPRDRLHPRRLDRRGCQHASPQGPDPKGGVMSRLNPSDLAAIRAGKLRKLEELLPCSRCRPSCTPAR